MTATFADFAGYDAREGFDSIQMGAGFKNNCKHQ